MIAVYFLQERDLVSKSFFNLNFRKGIVASQLCLFLFLILYFCDMETMFLNNVP